jgi:hypothetical protein
MIDSPYGVGLLTLPMTLFLAETNSLHKHAEWTIGAHVPSTGHDNRQIFLVE